VPDSYLKLLVQS